MYSADLQRLAARLPATRTLLVGVGNARWGDDGAGPFLVDLLSKRLRRQTLRFLQAGENPENHLREMRECAPETVILFDAVRYAGEDGEIILVDPGGAAAQRISTHTYNLSIFLDYLQRDLGSRAYLVGIKGEDFALHDRLFQLSPKVRTRLEAFADWLCEALGRSGLPEVVGAHEPGPRR